MIAKLWTFYWEHVREIPHLSFSDSLFYYLKIYGFLHGFYTGVHVKLEEDG
jgi:hypothetical protein